MKKITRMKVPNMNLQINLRPKNNLFKVCKRVSLFYLFQSDYFGQYILWPSQTHVAPGSL